MATQGAATYIVLRTMLHIPCWNGYFNVGGTEEDTIPNMIKLEPTCIPVECRIIYPYVDRFFN